MLYIYNIKLLIYNFLLVYLLNLKVGVFLLTTKLKQYRAMHNMNQEVLAQLVGVRRETIGHLERGNYNPSLKLAWDIAKVFNVPIEEIFQYSEDDK